MLSAIRNVDYVILLCQDLVRMRDFYHGTLGFPIYRALHGWIELRVGAVLLTLRERGRSYDGVKQGDHAGIQLAFRVTPAQVDACHDELRARQVEILEPPENSPSGHRTLFFRDPEGNILEIYADL
jgi:catechol 2,3-dioxygenase-like lactoylglutathione lyase family enzyme